MFENYRVFETTYAGRPLRVETGKTCALANGSCWVSYGETVVMANVTMSAKPRDGVDFFPLSVDYEEKLYSVGKIPGSFLKREGRPTENAILTSRMIDRPMRPLFPAGLRNDVSIVTTVLSSDVDNSPEITALIAASIAVSISDVPFNGPIAGVNVGLVDGELILNPNKEQREKSDLDLTVAASAEKVVMIEAGANEVPEDTMLEAIRRAHEESKKIVAFIKGIQDEIGKEKADFEKVGVNMDFYYAVSDLVSEKVKYALDTDDKNVREARLKPIIEEIEETFGEEYAEYMPTLGEVMYKLQKHIVREWLLSRQACRRPRYGRNPSSCCRSGCASPRAWLRLVHTRPDTGARHCDLRADPRCTDA